jgi:hyaluronoglucosaminidase
MTYPLRGIVEGFYGRPWTFEDRLDMFGFMQQHDLNAYIYAPKDDELHRDNWRMAYAETALGQFRTLAMAAQDHGIFFTFAMSPGLDLAYAEDGEIDALLAKVEPLLAMGVPSLGVFFDDVPPELGHETDRARYGNLGEAQADFLGRLHTRLPDVHWITVPTYYCGESNIPYLHSLAATPLAIDIMWTGPAICSREIRSDHMLDVADVLRRPAVLWDNYPVNDAAMIDELHIAPYRQRDGNLPVRGIYLNPMSLVQASKLPLATFADYVSDHNWYSPDVSWRKAATELVGADLTGPGLVDALAVFAESVTLSHLAPEQPQAMLDLVAPFKENRLPYTPNPAPAHLQAGTARMRAAHDQLFAAIERVPLLAEIEPWLVEYGHWIAMLEIVVEFFAQAREEDGIDDMQAIEALRARISDGLKASVDFRTATCGHVIRDFLLDRLRKSGEPVS